MDDTFGDRKTLPGVEGDRTVFEVDQELTVEDKKEFVVLIVFVPVVFAFDDPDADNAAIDLREGLVEPFVCGGLYDRGDVDELEMVVFDVEEGGVGELLFHS